MLSQRHRGLLLPIEEANAIINASISIPPPTPMFRGLPVFLRVQSASTEIQVFTSERDDAAPLAAAHASAFRFDLQTASIRIYNSAISIVLPKITLAQAHEMLSELKVSPNPDASSSSESITRFNETLLEHLDAFSAAIIDEPAPAPVAATPAIDTQSNESAFSLNSIAAEAEAISARATLPHLPTLSSLRWRGLLTQCFLHDLDPQDTDDSDILMNYQLEVKGSREVGVPAGGNAGGGADERNIEYIVRVSTADMSWTCYRRYHHFAAMHEAIKMHIEKLHVNAVFPPKKWLGNYLDPVFVKEREEALVLYISVISTELALRCHDAVRATFEINNICRAAFCGDVRRLAVLVKLGHNPSQLDSHGRAPIHLATMMRCDDALEFLLAKCVAPSAAFASSSFTTVDSPSTPTSGSARNVMVDLADRSGRTSLHYAALLGHAPAILLLLRAGANVNFADQQNMQPLHTAAAEGHLACVVTLLDPNAALAAHVGNKTWGRSVLLGADFSARDSNGWDARKHAQFNGHQAVVEYIDLFLATRRATLDAVSASPSKQAAHPSVVENQA